MGKRPDNAVVVYGNLIRRTFKKTPVILGGLEASLRRMSHYDYWSDRVRRSILLEAGADLISYGMGECSIVEIADALASGMDVRDITYIDGTVYKTRREEDIYDAVRLPDHESVCEPDEKGKLAYAMSFALQHANTDPFQAKRLYETYGGRTFVVQNPPAKPLSVREMDDIYALPYMRTWHPMYDAAGGVPALGEIRFSLTSNRGCYGDCNFCALTFHEGRIVQVRSHESILQEARQMLQEPDFKGNIYDVGGPTAEFRAPACKKQMTLGACKNRRCLFPQPCPNLEVDHRDYLASCVLFRGSKRSSSARDSVSIICWRTETGLFCGNSANTISADSCALLRSMSPTMSCPEWENRAAKSTENSSVSLKR